MAMSLILLPLCTAELLRYMGNYTKQLLVDNFGLWSQNTIGGLGVIIHELSHCLFALLFHHHIIELKLLTLHRPVSNGVLGVVKHSWNQRSIYSSLGNFFIGISPCFICSLFLFLIHDLFWHNETFVLTAAPNLKATLITVFNNLAQPFGTFGWRWIIFLILIIMISSTGYGLSDADMHGTFMGLPYWCILLAVTAFIVIISNQIQNISFILWFFIALDLTFTGWGIIYLLISIALIYLLAKVI